jgi:hypothetical protein
MRGYNRYVRYLLSKTIEQTMVYNTRPFLHLCTPCIPAESGYGTLKDCGHLQQSKYLGARERCKIDRP